MWIIARIEDGKYLSSNKPLRYTWRRSRALHFQTFEEAREWMSEGEYGIRID